MERVPVRSKDLAIVGYDPAKKILEIAFKAGGVYQYAGVPEEVHRDLMAASSHGTYFNEKIKDHYVALKVK